MSGKVSRCLVVGRYGRVRLPENKSAGFITTRALKKHCRALPSKVHRNREREREKIIKIKTGSNVNAIATETSLRLISDRPTRSWRRGDLLTHRLPITRKGDDLHARIFTTAHYLYSVSKTGREFTQKMPTAAHSAG